MLFRKKQQLKINNKIKKQIAQKRAIVSCCYCKKVFLLDDLTVEHIIPLSWGGTNDSSNVDLACKPCNQQRGRESWILKKQVFKKNFIS